MDHELRLGAAIEVLRGNVKRICDDRTARPDPENGIVQKHPAARNYCCNPLFECRVARHILEVLVARPECGRSSESQSEGDDHTHSDDVRLLLPADQSQPRYQSEHAAAREGEENTDEID